LNFSTAKVFVTWGTSRASRGRTESRTWSGSWRWNSSQTRWCHRN